MLALTAKGPDALQRALASVLQAQKMLRGIRPAKGMPITEVSDDAET